MCLFILKGEVVVPPGPFLYILTAFILFFDIFPSRVIETLGGVKTFSVYWKSSVRCLRPVLLGRPIVLLTSSNVIALSCWKLKCSLPVAVFYLDSSILLYMLKINKFEYN